MIKCELCGAKYKNIQPLSKHISTIHKIDKKLYYDTYLKNINEGCCKLCKKPTKYKSMGLGYNDYCSKHCQVKAQGNGAKIDHNKMWVIRRKHIEQYEKEHNCTHIQTIIKTYGNDWRYLDLPIIYESKMYQYISNIYLDTIKHYRYISYNGKSKAEKNILNFINYDGIIIENSKTIIKPLELDLYFPELSIAVEYNGIWYHSIEAGCAKDYHLEKSLKCRELGIRLIHIYEFEDFNIQMYKLNSLLNGIDLYNKNDFNKNNFGNIPKSELIYISNRNYHIYGAGKLL